MKVGNIKKASKYSKVKKKVKLNVEIKNKKDAEILIEQFLDGIEVSIGVIEYQDKIKVLPMTEIVTENDFFDYEAKYLGKSEEITPARVSVKQ